MRFATNGDMQCSMCSRPIDLEDKVRERPDLGLPVHRACCERQTGPSNAPAPTLAAYRAARQNAAA